MKRVRLKVDVKVLRRDFFDKDLDGDQIVGLFVPTVLQMRQIDAGFHFRFFVVDVIIQFCRVGLSLSHTCIIFLGHHTTILRFIFRNQLFPTHTTIRLDTLHVHSIPFEQHARGVLDDAFGENGSPDQFHVLFIGRLMSDHASIFAEFHGGNIRVHSPSRETDDEFDELV